MARGDCTKDATIDVRICESPYTLKWRLKGNTLYKLSANSSRVAFQDADDSAILPTIIGRGLIEYMCPKKCPVKKGQRLISHNQYCLINTYTNLNEQFYLI